MAKFKDVIESREQFRAIMREPHDMVMGKTINHLDKHCATFIERSPFVLLSSADAKGNQDVSPKGDPPGFVKIIDAHTLAIPDRLGNHRADSIENILQNPKVGLIFMIPGKNETLRVSGTASIVRDVDLRDSLAVKDRSPEFVFVINVEEAFFHCSKSMVRSKLWQKEHWPDLEGLPSMAQTMIDAGNLELSESDLHDIVMNDEKERLY